MHTEYAQLHKVEIYEGESDPRYGAASSEPRFLP